MDNRIKYQKSLIVCTTPLQVLIAQKIAALKNKLEIFDFIMLSPNTDKKYYYYYDFFNLKNKTKISLFFHLNVKVNRVKEFLLFKKKLKENFNLKSYENVYIASIDSRYIQIIISNIDINCQVFTYDDGVANIIKNSVYYKDNEYSFYQKILWRFLGVKFFMRDIKLKSNVHYSIYPLGFSNIIDRVQNINLFENFYIDSKKEKKEKIKFFLGQPILELYKDRDYRYVETIIKKFECDFYYPHPREKEIEISCINILNTHLIFEDYIINFIESNPGVNVEVYSFISSALLNLASLRNIKCNYLIDDYLYEKYKNYYDFVEKNNMVKCIFVDFNQD